jgi:hypothetical protein
VLVAGLHGSDDQLDDTHLMRIAGRFARRVKAGRRRTEPVIFWKAGESKHLIAEQYLEENSVAPGSHHPAGEEEGARLPLQLPHHGPVFGHLVIKMFGRPPFGAQVILNGHEYVAVVARGEWIGFVKEGNCWHENWVPGGRAAANPGRGGGKGCRMALIVRRAMAGVPGRRRLPCGGNQGLRLLAGW